MTHQEMAAVLAELYGDGWALRDTDLENIEWHRDDPKPDLATLEAALPIVLAARARRRVEEDRKAAYADRADPVFLRWQRGDATEQEWLDAVAAVKADHPYAD